MVIGWRLLIDVLQRGLLLDWGEWSPSQCLNGIPFLKFGLKKVLVSIYYHRRRVLSNKVVLEGSQVAQVCRRHFLMLFGRLRNFLNNFSLRFLACSLLRSGIAWWVSSWNHQTVVLWSVIVNLPLSRLIESRCLIGCYWATYTRLSLIISLTLKRLW
jgi:hypothetical protein